MYKLIFFAIAAATLDLAACTSNPWRETTESESTSADSPKNNAIPAVFIGNWERQFYPVPGKAHNVRYSIAGDSLYYSIKGEVVNASYGLEKDAFDAVNNRFVGHNKEGNYFVLFFKKEGDSIRIFKEPVASKEKGMVYREPPADYKANHNQGWNLYGKK